MAINTTVASDMEVLFSSPVGDHTDPANAVGRSETRIIAALVPGAQAVLGRGPGTTK